MRHNASTPESPKTPVQRIRDSLGGNTTLRLPDRLGGSAVKLPHSLFAGVLLGATLALLLLAPSWLGASQ